MTQGMRRQTLFAQPPARMATVAVWIETDLVVTRSSGRALYLPDGISPARVRSTRPLRLLGIWRAPNPYG